MKIWFIFIDLIFRRITGYLVGGMEGWNDAKAAELKQIDTVDLKVKDENGEMVKALVNTEVMFTEQSEVSYDNELDARPFYLCKSKENDTILLVKSYEGKEYYIPYLPVSYE